MYSSHKSYSSQVGIYFNFNFRYILQMYQGVFHSMPRCSPLFQHSLIFLNQHNYFFSHFSMLVPMGHHFHPNSRAIWGKYHPIFLLLCAGHLPSHTFSMGHQILPILGCFSLHITSPKTKGCINSHGAPFLPVSSSDNFSGLMGHLPFPYLLIISLDSWGTYPSHSHFSALIYPTFGTHGHFTIFF